MAVEELYSHSYAAFGEVLCAYRESELHEENIFMDINNVE